MTRIAAMTTRTSHMFKVSHSIARCAAERTRLRMLPGCGENHALIHPELHLHTLAPMLRQKRQREFHEADNSWRVFGKVWHNPVSETFEDSGPELEFDSIGISTGKQHLSWKHGLRVYRKTGHFGNRRCCKSICTVDTSSGGF